MYMSSFVPCRINRLEHVLLPKTTPQCHFTHARILRHALRDVFNALRFTAECLQTGKQSKYNFQTGKEFEVCNL